jgi:hypothetical protein
LLLLLDHLAENVTLGLLRHVIKRRVDAVRLKNLGKLVADTLVRQHFVKLGVARQVAAVV